MSTLKLWLLRLVLVVGVILFGSLVATGLILNYHTPDGVTIITAGVIEGLVLSVTVK